MKYLTIFLLFFSLTCSGQYKVLKEKYDYRDYKYSEEDKYSPSAASVLSFVVPGLGQMYCGETSRGFSHLFGTALFGAVFIHGYDLDADSPGPEQIVGMVGMVSISLFSIIDASHVAKVKNLHNRTKIEPSKQGIGFVVCF